MSEDYWRRPAPAWVNPMRLTRLPPKIGDGGPGTIYTATAFWDAVEKHGVPFGLFDKARQLPYKG